MTAPSWAEARRAEEAAFGLLTLAHYNFARELSADNGIDEAKAYLAARRASDEALVREVVNRTNKSTGELSPVLLDSFVAAVLAEIEKEGA